MNVIKFLLLSISAIGATLGCSCQTLENLQPVENPEVVLKDIMSLLTYQQNYMHFSEDFTAFDKAGKPITKDTFFRNFSEGYCLPLRIASKDKMLRYQLYTVPKTTNKDIVTTLQGWGMLGYKNYKMEGMRLPRFFFRDIHGTIYDSETTKHKIVVIKCWYLACQACRQEIPELNKLAKKYQDRKDIVFISLAFDSKEQLEKFSADNVFLYALVPDQKKYLLDELKIAEYPTHLVINKQGLISKVLTGPGEVVSVLDKMAAQ
jgi:peroxiredoxin